MFGALPEGREDEEDLGEGRIVLRWATLDMRGRGVSSQEVGEQDQ